MSVSRVAEWENRKFDLGPEMTAGRAESRRAIAAFLKTSLLYAACAAILLSGAFFLGGLKEAGFTGLIAGGILLVLRGLIVAAMLATARQSGMAPTSVRALVKASPGKAYGAMLSISQKGMVTGSDHGSVWFEGPYLHFTGTQTAFVVPSCIVRDDPEVEMPPLNHRRVYLNVGPRDMALSFTFYSRCDPNDWREQDIAAKRAIDSWKSRRLGDPQDAVMPPPQVVTKFRFHWTWRIESVWNVIHLCGFSLMLLITYWKEGGFAPYAWIYVSLLVLTLLGTIALFVSAKIAFNRTNHELSSLPQPAPIAEGD